MTAQITRRSVPEYQSNLMSTSSSAVTRPNDIAMRQNPWTKWKIHGIKRSVVALPHNELMRTANTRFASEVFPLGLPVDSAPRYVLGRDAAEWFVGPQNHRLRGNMKSHFLLCTALFLTLSGCGGPLARKLRKLRVRAL